MADGSQDATTNSAESASSDGRRFRPERWENNLAQTLLSESEAYGYTLTIWGSTTQLVRQFGLPSPVEVFGFVGGALVGFAALAFVAFDRFLAKPDPGSAQETKLVVSMIHFLAAFGNLLVVRLVVIATRGTVPPGGIFLIVGFQATVVYNLLLLVEHVLPSHLRGR